MTLLVACRVSAFLLCIGGSLAFSSSAGAADGEIRCGRLSGRVVEEKRGDMTHAVQVQWRSYEADRVSSTETIPSWGPPELGCVHDSALVLHVGDPVEGSYVIVALPNGHSVGLFGKDAEIDFRDGRVTVREPMPLNSRQRGKIPPEFLDLFRFWSYAEDQQGG
jgi:hypothetical protein